MSICSIYVFAVEQMGIALIEISDSCIYFSETHEKNI